MSLHAAGESASSISRSRSLPTPCASTLVVASTLAVARGSVSRPISPITVGASMVARRCRRPGRTLLYTSTVPEVSTNSRLSGAPSSRIFCPASKLTGSESSSNSARSSSSRCPKIGTSLRSGVGGIKGSPLYGPVCYEPVAEGLHVGLPPVLQLPDRLNDLLIEARQPPREGAGDAIGELERCGPAFCDHAPEGVAWDPDRLDLTNGPDRRGSPALSQQPPLPHYRPPARGVDLSQEPAPLSGQSLSDLDRAGDEHEQAPLIHALLDNILAGAKGDGLRHLRELFPLLLGQELEEPDLPKRLLHLPLLLHPRIPA